MFLRRWDFRKVPSRIHCGFCLVGLERTPCLVLILNPLGTPSKPHLIVIVHAPFSICLLLNHGRSGGGGGGRNSAGDVLDHILRELQLQHIQKPERVRVGILSRRRKRFILNEHELVSTILDMGCVRISIIAERWRRS